MMLKPWQKGALYSFLFVVCLSIIYTIALIYIDFKLEDKGLPHMCFIFSDKTECSLQEAIETRVAFGATLAVVIGIPLAIFGGFIGYLVEKLTIGE